MRWLIFAAALLIGKSAYAQAAFTPAELMAAFQELEHQYLLMQTDLLRREAELENPLWVRRSDGSYDVVDGAPLFDRVAAAVSFAAALGADEAIDQYVPDWMPQAARDELRQLAEQTADVQGDRIRQRIIEAYQAHSASVRAEAMTWMESSLDEIRANFEDAMAARDQDPAATLEDQLATHGATLPPDVTLVRPDALIDPDRECRPRGENPVWILVVDGANCSGQWSHRGSGEHDGISGDWCVWCPSGMHWRSGWGCCEYD